MVIEVREDANSQPWVFQMFVFMGQVRRVGMLEEARKLPMSVDTIANSSKLIEIGQKMGKFRQGDATLLAKCFWTAVQGIMEEMAFDKVFLFHANVVEIKSVCKCSTFDKCN